MGGGGASDCRRRCALRSFCASVPPQGCCASRDCRQGLLGVGRVLEVFVHRADGDRLGLVLRRMPLPHAGLLPLPAAPARTDRFRAVPGVRAWQLRLVPRGRGVSESHRTRTERSRGAADMPHAVAVGRLPFRRRRRRGRSWHARADVGVCREGRHGVLQGLDVHAVHGAHAAGLPVGLRIHCLHADAVQRHSRLRLGAEPGIRLHGRLGR
mmetsp:Transcript_14938/g.43092  ORF Transcript_14938/g.43092 Transcript_14938/m.43092 type:complete len:211 (-) Transcript_14938:255-887(-)